jgi:serine/threonine protein kinase
MLRAINDLHSLGFLHRQLKPEIFAIGRFTKIRTVYFTDFGEPFLYRDPKTKKVRFVFMRFSPVHL